MVVDFTDQRWARNWVGCMERFEESALVCVGREDDGQRESGHTGGHVI